MFKGFRWYDWMFGLMTYGLWIVFKILKNKWKEKASPSQLTSTDAVNNDGVSELPNNMESNETLSPKTSTDAVNNDGVSELPNNMESNETLSPKTALAAALVYTVGADGVLSPEETIFLEGALKGDTSLFNKGAEYTNKNSKDTFISEASELLNKNQKMCVIMNVADCILADGNIADEETALLYEFIKGFDVDTEKLEQIIELLSLKNSISALPNNMESNDTLSPKTALAAALIYTVRADGVVSPEEKTFLNVALKGDQSAIKKGAEYAHKNSKDTFISEASELLNKDQKMCVIINVTDCMVADGNIADEEASLLYEFFEGFGVAKEKTKPIIEFLAAKNISNNMGSNETLSPKTALAAALTYMVAADGVLSPEEETYLGGALKGDQSALKKGVEYAQKNSKDTFISEASELLNEGQKMCVIMNLAECSATAGSSDDEEAALLFEFLVGFGVATEELKPIMEFLSTKNSISDLPNNMESNETLSPKTALAAALVYMIAADGVFTPEEKTYLGVALKGDQSAIKLGGEYAQKNSKDTFISEASELLNEGQKMCVIMNLAECSASESSAADEEVALLFEFLVGFGVATEKLKPILEFLSTKNCIS